MQVPEDDQDQLVFVPARPLREPGQRGFELETRRFTDGERFGLAFSHPGALVDALGAYQPWICLPMRNVVAMLQLVGVRRLEIDPQLDDTVWRWDADALQEALARRHERRVLGDPGRPQAGVRHLQPRSQRDGPNHRKAEVRSG